jgi:hypothetical protein
MSERGKLIEEILDLHEVMTKHVINAGVGAQRWEKVISSIGKRSDNRVKFVHSFLSKLRQNEWKAIDTTWNLPCATEEMWENMEIFFDHDSAFPEMKRLRDEQRKLRETWNRFKEQYRELIRSEKEDSEEHGLND